MSINGATFKALKDLGLSGYEIQAFIALLSGGGLTARKVSQEGKIPYSKVYEVLSSLEEKGWIESEKKRPSRYYPKPPSEAVAITRLKFEDSLKKNGERVVKDLQPVYESKETHERPDIWIVRGEYNILARLKDICNRASKELLLAIPFVHEMLVSLFEPTLKMLMRRRVSVSIMTTINIDDELKERLKILGVVRFRDQMFGGGVISDKKEVLLLLGGENEGEDSLAIWSDHTGLARFAKSYFEYLWREASSN